MLVARTAIHICLETSRCRAARKPPAVAHFGKNRQLRCSRQTRRKILTRGRDVMRPRALLLRFGSGAVLAVTLLGRQVFAQPTPERNAYFGETHVHTSWSLDAWVFGDRITGPGDAYKYFKGEPIKHPLGYDVKIDTPLDWAGVTDHSEYVGVIRLANDPSSPISKLPAAQPFILKGNTVADMQSVYLYAVKVLGSRTPVKAFMAPEIAGTVWKENVELAEIGR